MENTTIIYDGKNHSSRNGKKLGKMLAIGSENGRWEFLEGITSFSCRFLCDIIYLYLWTRISKMRIKEVIIDGFKSYAHRTVVGEFDPSFNAITGLNGSGKSNILDSICFVLGISDLKQVCVGTNILMLGDVTLRWLRKLAPKCENPWLPHSRSARVAFASLSTSRDKQVSQRRQSLSCLTMKTRPPAPSATSLVRKLQSRARCAVLCAVVCTAQPPFSLHCLDLFSRPCFSSQCSLDHE
jgi:RecF/RecN/SMC family protein